MPSPKTKTSASIARRKTIFALVARVAWWLIVTLFAVIYANDIAALIANPQAAFELLVVGIPQVPAALAQLGWSQGAFAFAFLLPEFIAAAVFLAVGLLVSLRRPADWFSWFISLWMVVFGLTTTSIFGFSMNADSLLYFLPILFSYTGIVLFLFAFPDGKFHPSWARYFALAWALFVTSTIVVNWFPWDSPLSAAVIVPLLGVILYSQIYRYRNVSTPAQQEQTKWLIGAIAADVVLIALAGVLSGLAVEAAGTGASATYVLLANATEYLANLLLVLAVGIAILRYRLWDIEVVINRALIYGPLSIVLTAIFAVSVALINQSTRELLGSEATATAAAVSALIVATFFQPLRSRIEKWINSRIYVDNSNLAREFVELAPDMRNLLSVPALARLVAERTSRLLHSASGAVYLGDGPVFKLAASTQKGAKAALTLPEKDRKTLAAGKTISEGAPGILVPLYVPRLRSKEVIGVLSVGLRKDGRGYSSDDKRALADLGGEVGTALYALQLKAGARS